MACASPVIRIWVKHRIWMKDGHLIFNPLIPFEMKRTAIMLAASLVMFVSCQKEYSVVPKNTGVELTVLAKVANPVSTKTSYVYTSGTQAGTIATSWEETEYITLVSIGESGITAVDEFCSTGEAGREKAEFTGTWTGNAGDKVICLYPALTRNGAAVNTADQRFSGVTVGSTSISVNCPAHTPSQNISTIKNYDIMIGDVTISGTAASVTMQRKISVIRLGVSGAYPYEYGVYARYFKQLGIAAHSSGGTAKLFASSGTVAATASTWTGEIVPDAYYSNNWNNITQISKEGTYYHYIPVLANGSLVSGDILSVCFTHKEYSGTKWDDDWQMTKDKVLESTLEFSPGYVYAINAAL